jgi:hypothetical protein
MLAPRTTSTLAAAAVAVALACVGCGSSATLGAAAVPTPAPTAVPTRTSAPTTTATPAPPTIAPTVTPTPSPAPSVAAGPPTLDHGSVVACAATNASEGCLDPGTYQLSSPSSWPATVTFDVPAGWFEWSGGIGWDAVLVDKGRGPSGWGVMFYTVGDVTRDPCDVSKGSIPAAQVDTPQKLAAVMAAWPHFTATARQPITLDGHDGVRFRLIGTTKNTCTDQSFAGQSASGTSVDAWPMVSKPGTHGPSTVEIVDTGNGLLVIRATDFPQTSSFEVGAPNPTYHTGDLADLHAILDSIRLSAPPAAP